MNDTLIIDIVGRKVLELLKNDLPDTTKIPVGVSLRHSHLCEEDVFRLFGKNYKLTRLRDLTQKGQYVCEEVISLATNVGMIEKVRLLGPPRRESQVEISLTDAFKLGIRPPVVGSGNLEGTPGIALIGPKGIAQIEKGVMLSQRHIHMNIEDSIRFRVKDKDIVKVRTFGPRALILENVLIRVAKDFVLDFHIDADEANAALLKTGDMVEMVV